MRPKVYLSSPHLLIKENHLIASTLREVCSVVHLPYDICQVEDRVGDQCGIRRKCIEAIEDCDFLVMYLDEYGMDSAWELGYAEKAGKHIIGFTLDPKKLDLPRTGPPETIWDHWMHDWTGHAIFHDIHKVQQQVESSSVYFSFPLRFRHIGKLFEDAFKNFAKRIHNPLYFVNATLRSMPRRQWIEPRRKCIEAIEDCDILVIYLDEYGMDSAWELGYAEKAGKRIIGFTLDPEKLDLPRTRQPETIWDHWMHGWTGHTILRGIDQLTTEFIPLPYKQPASQAP